MDTTIRSLPVYSEKTVTQYTREGIASIDLNVLGEEPLSIRVQGKPYAVVMRTPGDEIPHVVGFCLGEGIIDGYDDIKQIAFCDGTDTNVVTITLQAARRLEVGPILERRGFISQTSCGICGKEVVSDLIQSVQPLRDQTLVSWRDLLGCLDNFSARQSLYRTTRTSHAAVAFDAAFQPQTSAEDVGRHNAVDKAIGKLLIDGAISRTICMILSSRISYELVQKVARARIPIILAMSRPTQLAVDLAEKLNITLACSPDEETLLVYTGNQRLKKE